MDDTRGGETRWFTIFLGVVSSALAVVVILLVLQNRQLKNRLAALPDHAPPPLTLHAGDLFGPLVLVDDAGARLPVTFDAGSGDTLLLIFSVGCPACKETLPVWDALLSEPTRAELRVMGLQLDRGEEPDALVAAALPFPVFGVDHAASESLGKVSHIPTTVLLDGEGRVRRAWVGVLTDEGERELRAAIRDRT